jgi:hypothetical protein
MLTLTMNLTSLYTTGPKNVFKGLDHGKITLCSYFSLRSIVLPTILLFKLEACGIREIVYNCIHCYCTEFFLREYSWICLFSCTYDSGVLAEDASDFLD